MWTWFIMFMIFILTMSTFGMFINKYFPETVREQKPASKEHKQSVRAKDAVMVKWLTDVSIQLASYIDVAGVSSPATDNEGKWFMVVSFIDESDITVYYEKTELTPTEYIEQVLGLKP